MTTLYSAVDATLSRHELDATSGVLTRRAGFELPAKLQYAWPHPTLPVLYTTTSNGGPRVASDFNQVSAWSVGPAGDLRPLGSSQSLARRAVHLCVDPAGRYVINAFNFGGGGLGIHALQPDGSVGDEVSQPSALDLGIYPHQVRVFPSGRTVLVVDRGNKTAGDKPEDPGALRSFGFHDGVLSPGSVVAPAGGYGFGPRHVDFHPTQPWLYASDERMNRLHMFRFDAQDRLEPLPAWTLSSLAEPGHVRPRQIGGPIHVHPSGRFVYVANRADQTVEVNGAKVFGGGENSIAVFAIDPATGEPRLLQHADTRSIHVRTFSIDPSGRWLVAGSIKPHAVLADGQVEPVPAALTVFRIEDDGRLIFAGRHAVEVAPGQMQYWMGMPAFPASAS